MQIDFNEALIGSTQWEFFISSSLCVLEVLFCLYHNSELQVYRSLLDHKYSCKTIFFVCSLKFYIFQNKHLNWIYWQFLSNRSQHGVVDGCRSKLVNIVSIVPHGFILDQLLFLLYTSHLLSILENKRIGYADDSTLLAVVSSPGVSYSSRVHEPWFWQG